MLRTQTLQTYRRTGAQFIVLAAVAALGIGFGRWVVPEAGGIVRIEGPAIPGAVSGPSQRFFDRKLAQMDDADLRLAQKSPAILGAISEPSQRFFDRKLAQMDDADLRLAQQSPAILGAISEPSQRFFDRKLAQMDDADLRLAQHSPAIPGAISEPTQRFFDRKVAQMDDADMRLSGSRVTVSNLGGDDAGAQEMRAPGLLGP